MPKEIIMPKLGESVVEGVIGKWLKAEGDFVDEDEPLVEVDTDKVNAEVPSTARGIVHGSWSPRVQTVAVGPGHRDHPWGRTKSCRGAMPLRSWLRPPRQADRSLKGRRDSR